MNIGKIFLYLGLLFKLIKNTQKLFIQDKSTSLAIFFSTRPKKSNYKNTVVNYTNTMYKSCSFFLHVRPPTSPLWKLY